jgi:putative acetyltransferase
MTNMSEASARAVIRAIAPGDDAATANVIRTVMPRYGAKGPGFALSDPEVDAMYHAYNVPRSRYRVIEIDGAVVGGGGVAPLLGALDDTCELKKMYFLDVARGHGLGRRLLEQLLADARAFGYRTMYLETLTGMDEAMKLYRKLGFQPTCRAGETGHFGCDLFFSRPL